MPPIKLFAFSTIALLGAVKVYETAGLAGLLPWTIVAIAASHSKSPGETPPIKTPRHRSVRFPYT